jgi:hypothetical protein
MVRLSHQFAQALANIMRFSCVRYRTNHRFGLTFFTKTSHCRLVQRAGLGLTPPGRLSPAPTPRVRKHPGGRKATRHIMTDFSAHDRAFCFSTTEQREHSSATLLGRQDRSPFAPLLRAYCENTARRGYDVAKL